MSLEGLHTPEERRITETSASDIKLGDQIQTAEGSSDVVSINRRPSGEYDIILANDVNITLDSDDSIAVTR